MRAMRNEYLDELVSSGTLHSYYYCNIDENLNEDKVSQYRNAERLILRFHDGKKLKLDTTCTGINNNTKILIFP